VILAKAKGLNELAFMGDIVQFPQNGFGATEKKISESPDQIYRMGAHRCAACDLCPNRRTGKKSWTSS
jgi:hypothetical protein